jgi:hypothetical protein
LTTITGFGAIVASALVAAVGHAESFDRGRDMAAWLGLVLRQFTTGGKPRLLGIRACLQGRGERMGIGGGTLCVCDTRGIPESANV